MTCGWADLGDLPNDRPDLDPDVWCALLERASTVLWSRSGRKWRGCSFTESAVLDESCAYRPSRRVWVRRVRLPRPDVTDIVSVVADGVPVDGWWLSGNWLHRGKGSWRLDGSTIVTYRFGRTPPPGGVEAAVALALHYGTRMGPDTADDRVPDQVTALQRQGISYELVDVTDTDTSGVTVVEEWLSGINPGGVTQEACVWSPDLVTGRRTS